MLSRLPRCVSKTKSLLPAAGRSLPCAVQSHVSVYKRFGTSAVRFESQSLHNPLSTISPMHGELNLRNEDDFTPNTPRSAFHVVYLRDSCTCSHCVDPSTTQKLFETADIPDNIQGKISRENPDGSVTVAWQNDIPGYEDHQSTYTSDFITSSFAHPSRLSALHNREQEPVLWDQNIMATRSAPTDYKAFISSSAALYHALLNYQKFGIFFLCNVPSHPDAVTHMSDRMGIIRNTIYGPIWDVKSDPSAKNVAYTSSYLGFHMDLLYLADPPELQILHCLRAGEEGGESLFSDTFRAVETMRQQRSPLLKTLAEFPVTYWYKNDGHNFQYTKRTVEMEWPPDDHTRDADFFSQVAATIKAVNWAPPFQAPLVHGINNNGSRSGEAGNSLSDYLAAVKVFKRLIEDPASVYETRLAEGTCAIFNNRRIVHARRAFTQREGTRWLRGAYVDRDAFSSRWRILEEEMSTGAMA